MSTISASGEPHWYIKQESDRIFGSGDGDKSVYTFNGLTDDVSPPLTATITVDGKFEGDLVTLSGMGAGFTTPWDYGYESDFSAFMKRIEALEAMVNQLIVAKYLDKEAANEPKYDPVRLQDDFYFGTAEGKLIPRNVATQMTDEQQATEAYERAMKVVK